MRWGAKITDTAKMSHKGRCLFLRKVDTIVQRLTEIRLRAIRYASFDSIAALACEIPLSEASAVELADTCTPREDGAAWMESGIANDDRGGQTQELPCGLWCDELPGPGADAFTIEGTWFEFVDMASICAAKDAGCSDEPLDTTGHRVSDDETAVPLDGLSSAPSLLSGDDDGGHVLLNSWGETFPGRLEQYLDYLDQTSPDLLRSMQSSNDLSSRLNLDVSCTAGQDLNLPISGIHLVRLQQDLAEACKYRKRFNQSMSHVRRSLKCKQSRWYREGSPEEDLTFVMKSGGFGSPLVESITADEAWPSDDEWGRIAGPRRRSMLCGREASISISVDADEGRGGYAAMETSRSKSPRTIHW